MNNQLTAANLAGYGRGPDTTLVHMAPQEVAGLQALAMAHGGSLTLNPETGLPEAGFLSSILPTLAGFALGPAGFGVMSSLGAAATVGGLSALTSGSLSKGLVAGLGAYGGSEIGGGLEALGKQGAAQAAATVADAGASGPLTGAAFSNSAPAALSGWDATKAGFNKAISDPKALIGQLGGNMGALKTAGMAVAPMIADQGVQTVTKAPESPQYYRPMVMERQQTGGTRMPGAPETSERTWFKDTYTAPEPRRFADGGSTAYPENPYYSLTGQSEDAYRYLMGLEPRSRPTPPVTPPPTGGGNFVMPKKPEPVVTPGAGNRDGDGGPGGGQDFVNTSTPDWGTALSLGQKLSDLGLNTLGDYLQSEGRMGINAQTGAYSQEAQNQRAAEAAAMQGVTTPTGVTVGGPMAERGVQGVDLGPLGGDIGGALGGAESSVDPALNANGGMIGRYASGGLGSLGGYSDGGRLLRGPGDGVSDSIPATIGRGRQPARLADGEFVVPARIVSELGNGSTEAGARKLYAMMDRIQANRRKSMGKKKVAVNSRSERLLPA